MDDMLGIVAAAEEDSASGSVCVRALAKVSAQKALHRKRELRQHSKGEQARQQARRKSKSEGVMKEEHGKCLKAFVTRLSFCRGHCGPNN